MSVFAEEEVQGFINNGFVAVRGAFSPELASQCRDAIWELVNREHPDVKFDDSSTWEKDFIRIEGSDAEPIVRAANAPRLCQAYNEIIGAGRWRKRNGIGTFPIRFPVGENAEASGWHIDGSIEVEDHRDGYNYTINLVSDNRALLVLFLFTDITEIDGPTRLAIGSHSDVVKALEHADPKVGMFSNDILEEINFDEGNYQIDQAIGQAGDVFLVHPFTIHAGNVNRGNTPRIIAQPELPPIGHYELDRQDGNYSPAEQAVRIGLGL